ncbi:MAG: methylenetetrahydrofolate reductase [Solirubrobacteraceae bacterium]|nr:methylenetetrahydrofolate reductase [Solirubrobacteraceae bacterium]MEA2138301.1 methylenetetrahydrofolate reductase [Solirubrobacteraceae bacterium]
MKLRDIYAQPGKTFSVEFYPPKDDAGVERLFVEVQELKKLNPAFCSVTYGAGGSTQDTTLEIVRRLRHEAGLEVMCHLTVVNQPKSQVHGVLDYLRDNGIENLIALAGDPPRGSDELDWTPHPDGYHHSRELVEDVLAMQSDWFSIAVAGFPEVHPRAVDRESDLRYLKEKVDAGADVIITQLFYDNEDFFRYVDDVRALGIDVPIVPGMMLIQSSAQCRRIASMCKSKIPRTLERMLEQVEGDPEAALQLGIDYTTQQCQALLDYGVPGFHFYSLNKARQITAIFDNLKLQTLAAA